MSPAIRFSTLLHKWAQRLAPDHLYQHSVLPSLPWAFVETVVVRELPRLIPSLAGKTAWTIIDVGAYTGEEILKLKAANPGKTIKAWLYEANPDSIAVCRRQFANDPSVEVIGKAVGGGAGEATFHEASIVGNGSLLPLARGWLTRSQPIETVASFPIEVVGLDDAHPDLDLDLLWMDVQGGELTVMQGAQRLLKRTSAVYLEVQHGTSVYRGGATFHDVDDHLRSLGFSPYLLGVDVATGQGNAFYLADNQIVRHD